MKKMKRICTLLLAIVLTASMSLQPDIGRAFADNVEQTGQMTESAEKSAGGAENAGESSEKVFYKQLMACSSLTDFEALLCDEENVAALDALTEEELNQLVARVDEICAAIADPTEADTCLKEKALKKLSEYTDEPIQKDSEPAKKGSPAKPKKKKAATMKAAEDTNYIYFDLAAGDVEIGKDSYSGKVYVAGKETEVKSEKRTGKEKFYIYQSTDANKLTTGYLTDKDWEEKKCTVPEYSRVKYEDKAWREYITNNTNVEAVSEAWEAAMQDSTRKPLGQQNSGKILSTGNRIIFAKESDYTADVTIDNIWTYYQQWGQTRATGGITANLVDAEHVEITLRLKGDNRFGNIHYGANKDTKNKIIFIDGEDDDKNPGSITVADFPKALNKNRWGSAIGGDDNTCDRSDGIVIKSGVIYAGTTWEDNCTAIGGGGNAYGRVTIDGGTVTAVTAGTGTAIGGGIGYSDPGGDTEVIINGGEIYAYNLGVKENNDFPDFVPSAAIGGGGSKSSAGGLTADITITGGTIYAQSKGGPGIGGGGSANAAGGPANITITGGTIIAKSTGGSYGSQSVDPGVSIGGGTGGKNDNPQINTDGGSVTLKISQKEEAKPTILRTGSIGGGKSTGGKLGSANVTISGGDITGQVIMQGTDDKTKNCTFDMSDGTIHNTNVIEGFTVEDTIKSKFKKFDEIKIEYLEKNGGAVWMNDSFGVTTITGGTIENCRALNGGAIYMTGGTFTLSEKGEIINNKAQPSEDGTDTGTGSGTTADTDTIVGMGGAIYMGGGNANINGGTISYNVATENGGGVYLPGGDFVMNDGAISRNTAKNGGGIFLSKGPDLYGGTISENIANENGGGLYIKDSLVTLKPKKDLNVIGNIAKNNGAGIYIYGSESGTESPSGSETEPPVQSDGTTGATPIPGDAVGLLASEETSGQIYFTDNKATGNGGAVCVNTHDKKSRFELDTDNITVTGNTAANGGGVAVLNGNFTMTAGSIGSEGEKGANTATNGGGVYVSTGEVWLKGGSVQYNSAENGGGAYVNDGRFYMMNGTLAKNEATENGGGAYVAGDFHMLNGIIGGENGGNSADNGGGVYVKDGNVTVLNGTISYNKARKDGGGFCVSSSSENVVKVVMLSGSLSNNEATENGGGMAVESSAKPINVEIGCLLNHNVKNGSPSLPIGYEGSYSAYATYYGKMNQHETCPVVENNKARKIGGGFYMNSDTSTLSFYCVKETNNHAGGSNTAGMDVVGGKVIIGDEYYHNHVNDSTNNSGKTDGEHGDPWGYISMDDATLVNGGQVDIYGDMTNPIFREEVTVDIESQNDHFLDHRRAHENEQNYKVHYIENFKGTGLYQAFQYDKDHSTIEIKGALYSHPGYKILGWYTKREYNPAAPDEGHKFYPVGGNFDLSDSDQVPQMGQQTINCNICGENKPDSNLLELYAIWEANGYTVVFDPNVPAGDAYTGEMENQIHSYGETLALSPNQYKYPGHIFQGWNTKADGNGMSYIDRAEVSNLTDQNGVEIVLYAQWSKCNHSNPEWWAYDVVDEGKTLRRICSCGGQTLTATLNAENTIYDGSGHPATLTFNDEVAWGTDKPTITYEGERLTQEDTTKYGVIKVDNGEPFHAGNYTASITKKNGETPVTAAVKYTIAKADQDAPAKPTYVISDDGKSVVIHKLKEDPKSFTDSDGKTHEAKAEYCLTHKEDNSVEWKTIEASKDEIKIPLQSALTNHIIQARYQELEDYNVSDVTRAAEVYFFAGNVKVVIICDEGIECKMVTADGNDSTTNGVVLTLETKDGFYLVGGEYDVKTELKKNDSSTSLSNPTVTKDSNGKVSVTNIEKDSTLTITIGRTKKATTIEAKVMPGQEFSKFTNDPQTEISRDSAFTAAFEISNFDPDTYDVPSLTFESAIPKDTTIILLERKGGEKTYWYYPVKEANAITSLQLENFKKMGDSNTTFTVPKAEGDDYIDLNYQFIVDFSQSADGYPKNADSSLDNLNMKLKVPLKNEDATTPQAVEEKVEVVMNDSTFKLEKEAGVENDLTNSFTCTFTKDATASKWENRASALILTPKSGTELPADARIKAQIGDRLTYLYKSNGSFIVPMPLLKKEQEVKLTLESTLFPAEGKSYTFTAKWLISPSKTGKAPLNYGSAIEPSQMIGDQAGNGVEVTFTSVKSKTPSLKMTGDYRILDAEGTLNLKIQKLNMAGYTISADLLRKGENGLYSGVGTNYTWQETTESGKSELSMPYGSTTGSYCVMLTVKKTGSATIIMEVPYYFIVKEKKAE